MTEIHGREIYQRCTVAFVGPDGRIAGYEWVEAPEHLVARPAFLHWLALDQLHRRGPQIAGARAALWIGKLSAEECAQAMGKT